MLRVRDQVLVIILEGPDGGGKTTLLNNLLEKTKLKQGRKGVSPSGYSLVGDMKNYVEKNLVAGFQPKKVFDRFSLISGPIYGQFNNMAPPNEIYLNRAWHCHMEALLMSMRPIIIYCLPPLPVIRTNLLRDAESSQVVGENIEGIYMAYQSRMARDFAVGLAMIWDYTVEKDANFLISQINNRLGHRGMNLYA